MSANGISDAFGGVDTAKRVNCLEMKLSSMSSKSESFRHSTCQMFLICNFRHDIANPDDNDFFPNPDQPIESEQTAVYVIPGKQRGDLIMLPMHTKLALETGRAAYESDL